jgi:hypothetical protein
MSSRTRSLFVTLSLLVVPVIAATTLVADRAEAQAKKDPLADALGGQLLFLTSSPPAEVSGPGWFTSHKITTKDENSDKKWVLNCMLFVKKELDSAKVDLMIYKSDKNGANFTFVEKREQYLTGEGRSFFFPLTIAKDNGNHEPNLKYQIKVLAGGASVAEGTIQLNGKEEKISGGPIDFTKEEGGGYRKVNKEKITTPFDNADAKKSLNEIIYEDCRGIGAPSGSAVMMVTFSAEDGKVVKAEFSKETAIPFNENTQGCIRARFAKAKIKPFGLEDTHSVTYKIKIDK